MTYLRGTVFSCCREEKSRGVSSMHRSLLWLLVLVLGVAAPLAAHAQSTSVYLAFDATRINTDGQTNSRTLFGPVGGLVFNLHSGHKYDLGVDMRGFFTQEIGDGSAIFGGVLAGPKVTTHIKRTKPYGEFLIGFGRYKNGSSTFPINTTDMDVALNAGLDFELKKHFDWRVVEYSWQKYLGLSGEFNPRGYSTGIVFHY